MSEMDYFVNQDECRDLIEQVIQFKKARIKVEMDLIAIIEKGLAEGIFPSILVEYAKRLL